MRRAALAALLVAAALVLQLTVVNPLSLPGGGAPDLVLLVVIALALCGGPRTGMLTGFCAGLSLDLAPPASQLIGEYALVFCIVGYGCGKLRGTLGRSVLLPLAAAAAAAAAGEALYAGIGLALNPAQVTWATVSQVLPSSAGYDVLISSPVLYLVMLASRWIDDRLGAGLPDAARQGDRWLGGRPATLPAPATWPGRRGVPRLRPGAGIAGSAAGGQQARAGQVRSPAGRLHPARFHPARFQPARFQPGRSHPAMSRPARSRPARFQPARAQSAWTRPARTRPAAGLGPQQRPVNLRLAAGRRGGKVRSAAGGTPSIKGASPRITFSGRSARGSTARWSRAVGRGIVRAGTGRPARSRRLRPAAGVRGGSAADSALPRQTARQIRFRPGKVVGLRPGKVVGLRPGRAAGFRPGRAAGFRPGKVVGLRRGRAAGFRRGGAVRLGSGRRSLASVWTLGIAGRRSNTWRTGGRRTGGSR